MADQLPFGEPEPPAAPAKSSDAAMAPTPLYAAERQGNAAQACQHCGRDNPMPRLWCTSCGHGLGMPLADCVCEACLKGGE